MFASEKDEDLLIHFDPAYRKNKVPLTAPTTPIALWSRRSSSLREEKFKVIIMGSGRCGNSLNTWFQKYTDVDFDSLGKTSIINRIVYGKFNPKERVTIGCEFHVMCHDQLWNSLNCVSQKKALIHDDKRVSMKIFDIAGQVDIFSRCNT